MFPTHVGMIQMDRGAPSMGGRVPHARGDDPTRSYTAYFRHRCSPRTWG